MNAQTWGVAGLAVALGGLAITCAPARNGNPPRAAASTKPSASAVPVPSAIPSASVVPSSATATRAPDWGEYEGCGPWLVEGEDPDTSEACAMIGKRNLAVFSKLPPMADFGGGGFDPAGATGGCYPAKSGSAWGMVFNSPRVSGDPSSGNYELTANWRLIHVDPKGGIVTAPDSHVFTASPFGGTAFGGIDSPSISYDFDGDGDDELLLLEGTSEHTGSGDFHGSLWTFKSGKIRRYPSAPPVIARPMDVDCDGRPDLLTDAPFIGEENCSSYLHTSVMGPFLVAHSLKDGTFSMSDEVAIRQAREGCGEPPSPFKLDEEADQSPLEALARIRCARLWGKSTATLEREIRAACRPPGTDDGCMVHHPGVCMEYQRMLEWARAKPPLVLR